MSTSLIAPLVLDWSSVRRRDKQWGLYFRLPSPVILYKFVKHAVT